MNDPIIHFDGFDYASMYRRLHHKPLTTNHAVCNAVVIEQFGFIVRHQPAGPNFDGKNWSEEREYQTQEDAAEGWTRLRDFHQRLERTAWAAAILPEGAPDQFRAQLAGGDWEALPILADWFEDRGACDEALVCRAIRCRLDGRANVEFAGALLNVAHVTPRYTTADGTAAVHVAKVEPGKSVAIITAGGWERGLITTLRTREFLVGDTAEVGSFNLVYMGEILTITRKTVTVKEPHRTRTNRFSIGAFVAKNYDFDAAKAAKRNADWTD